MNDRDRILAICNRHNLIPQATVELAEEIIAIIKEDSGRPNLRPFQQKEVDDLMESFKKPQLIQGYTAKQWQEIIDGGYLCEVSMFAEYTSSYFTVLKELRKGTTHDFVIPRLINNATCYSHCRPAQIKGIMRPIFVEPVDKEAYCHFFSGSGSLLFSGKWEESGSLSQVTEQVKMLNGATKYIEL